jgi:hypothetical protein
MAREERRATGQWACRFKELTWSTRKSWSRKRRVIAKAEWTQGEANPRFIVTSLTAADGDGRRLYEEVYCARGEMENRITLQATDLADATCGTIRRKLFKIGALVTISSRIKLAMASGCLQSRARCGILACSRRSRGLLNQEFIQALSCISAPRGRREAGHSHCLAWKAVRSWPSERLIRGETKYSMPSPCLHFLPASFADGRPCLEPNCLFFISTLSG